CIVGAEPLIFHCHHYNVALQQGLLDAAYGDFEPVLVGAAASVAHAQLGALFADGGVTSAVERARVAEALFRWAGFGTLELAGIGPDGGRVATTNSHYAHGCRAKLGRSETPVCY